jgi:hypothetical protein
MELGVYFGKGSLFFVSFFLHAYGIGLYMFTVQLGFSSFFFHLVFFSPPHLLFFTFSAHIDEIGTSRVRPHDHKTTTSI